jgi:hypothetical protein
MRKRIELKARLKKLEDHKARKLWKRRIIFSIDKMRDSDVVGMHDSSGKVHVMRNAGEALPSFESRAAGVLGAQFLFRVYSTPSSASDAESGAEVAPSAA